MKCRTKPNKQPFTSSSLSPGEASAEHAASFSASQSHRGNDPSQGRENITTVFGCCVPQRP